MDQVEALSHCVTKPQKSHSVTSLWLPREDILSLPVNGRSLQVILGLRVVGWEVWQPLLDHTICDISPPLLTYKHYFRFVSSYFPGTLRPMASCLISCLHSNSLHIHPLPSWKGDLSKTEICPSLHSSKTLKTR